MNTLDPDDHTDRTPNAGARCTQPDPGGSHVDCTVVATWMSNGDATTRAMTLRELATIDPERTPDRDLCRVDVACEREVPAFEAITARLDPTLLGELGISVNGQDLQLAETTAGGVAAVLCNWADDIMIWEYSFAHWETGAPVSYDQWEGIYSFEDLYWTEAAGDTASNLMCVGRFDDSAAGVAAAAEASVFHSVSPTGDIVCELEEYDDEYDEDE